MSRADNAAVVQGSFAQRYGNAAQIASAVVAAFALMGVYLQVQSNLRLSREGSAREVYRAYLQLAVEHPELAYPEGFGAGIAREQRARYGWFVSYLLYTCEQILASFPNDPQWQRACLEQIAYHRSYLCSDVVNEGEINDYDLEMRALIKQAARASSAGACKAS